MATVKEHLRALAKSLPDDCTFEDAINELYVVAKIEHGLASIDRGEGIPHEQVMREVYTWLRKSSGRRRPARTSSK